MKSKNTSSQDAMSYSVTEFFVRERALRDKRQQQQKKKEQQRASEAAALPLRSKAENKARKKLQKKLGYMSGAQGNDEISGRRDKDVAILSGYASVIGVSLCLIGGVLLLITGPLLFGAVAFMYGATKSVTRKNFNKQNQKLTQKFNELSDDPVRQRRFKAAVADLETTYLQDRLRRSAVDDSMKWAKRWDKRLEKHIQKSGKELALSKREIKEQITAARQEVQSEHIIPGKSDPVLLQLRNKFNRQKEEVENLFVEAQLEKMEIDGDIPSSSASKMTAAMISPA